MKINLHIERLVLDGLPVRPGDSALLQMAAEQELGRLLAGGDSLARLSAGGWVASINGGTIRVVPGGKADALGRQIATAVHGGLGGAPNAHSRVRHARGRSTEGSSHG